VGSPPAGAAAPASPPGPTSPGQRDLREFLSRQRKAALASPGGASSDGELIDVCGT